MTTTKLIAYLFILKLKSVPTAEELKGVILCWLVSKPLMFGLKGLSFDHPDILLTEPSPERLIGLPWHVEVKPPRYRMQETTPFHYGNRASHWEGLAKQC